MLASPADSMRSSQFHLSREGRDLVVPRDDVAEAPISSQIHPHSPLSQSSSRANQMEEMTPCQSPVANARQPASLTSVKRNLSGGMSPLSAGGEYDFVDYSSVRLSSPEYEIGNSSADGLNYDLADVSRHTRGGAAIVNDVVACGVEVNFANKYGRTALHYAAMEGSEGACNALLRAGADASIKDKDGKMPYEFAGLMKRGGWKECEVLLRRAVPSHLLPPPPAKEEKKGKKKKK